MDNESYLHSDCEGHTNRHTEADKNSAIDPYKDKVGFLLAWTWTYSGALLLGIEDNRLRNH